MQEKEKVFQVILRGVAPWVSKISYQKEERDIKLLFSLSSGKISPQDIIVADSEQENQQKKLTSRLQERLLAGLEYIPALQLYASSLEASDFSQEAGPKLLPDACSHVCSRLGQGCLFFYQASREGAVKGLLLGGTQEVRGRILRKFPGQEKGKWLLFDTPHPTIREAKTYTLETLSLS